MPKRKTTLRLTKVEKKKIKSFARAYGSIHKDVEINDDLNALLDFIERIMNICYKIGVADEEWKREEPE